MFGLFELAKGLRHPLSAFRVWMPADMSAAVDKVCELRGGTAEWREWRLRTFERVSASLQGFSARLREQQPPHVALAAGDFHVALGMACVDGIGWPHSSFAVEQGVTGFQVVGERRDTGVWRRRGVEEMEKLREHFVSPEVLFASNKQQTTLLADRLRRQWRHAKRVGDCAAVERMTAAWDASMQEVKEKGVSEGPFSISVLNDRYGWGRYRPSARHAVWQNGRWRACDNLRGNGTNASFLSHEALVVPGPDAPATVCRAYEARAAEQGWLSDCDFGGGEDDESDAYRHSPTATPQLTVVLVVDPATGDVRSFVPHGHNFGLEAAVLNYCSKPELICSVVRRLFAGTVEHFFDDFFSGEPRFALGRCSEGSEAELRAMGGLRYPASTQGALWRTMACLGCGLQVKKHGPWSRTPTFVGVLTDFSGLRAKGVIRLRCKGSTVAKVRAIAKRAVEEDHLSPAQASSLRGKLLWVWLYGRVGRAEMRPFKDRQYGRCSAEVLERQRLDSGGGAWPLDEPLRRAFGFVDGMLAGELPDVVLRALPRSEAPVVVLSDASWHPVAGDVLGAGHMAFVVWVPGADGGGRTFFADAEADRATLQSIYGMREQRTLICPLEAVALAAPYCCPELRVHLEGRDVLHFADNMAANAAAMRGDSAAADLARVQSVMHARWHALGLSPWVEYVRSKANLSDLPSRGQYDALVGMGAKRVEFRVPSLDGIA